MSINEGELIDIEDSSKPKFKPLSDVQLKHLGLTYDNLSEVDTLEDLKQRPHNLVIGQCVKNMSFRQIDGKIQRVRKKNSYVMSLGVFQQLHQIPDTKIKVLKPSTYKFNDIYKQYNGESLENKKLLIWRTGGIGDLLFIQPNIKYLKEKYPTSKISFACGPLYHPMIETWDCIDEVMTLPFTIRHLFEADYHAIFEGVIERCKEAKNNNAYRLFTKWLNLNLPDNKLFPEQKAKEELVIECRNILKNWNIDDKQETIIVQMRASSPIRTPDPIIWKRLIQKLVEKNYKIIITDSSRMDNIIDDFINELDCKESVFNFCKYSKSIDYTIAMVSLMDMALGTDSALMHIAESLGIKSAGVYGPFPGKIRLATYKNSIWEDCDTYCSPCFKHGHLPCPNSTTPDGFSRCFYFLDLDKFSDRIDRFIKNGEKE